MHELPAWFDRHKMQSAQVMNHIAGVWSRKIEYPMIRSRKHQPYLNLNDESRMLAALRAELPDETGIRRQFVAHIRELIDAGVYDTPERLAITEELLLSRFENR